MSIIFKEEVTHTIQLIFGLCSEFRQAEKGDEFCCRSEVMLQHDGKEDPEQGWHKNTAMLNFNSDVKSGLCLAVEDHSSLHIIMKGSDNTEEPGCTTDL